MEENKLQKGEIIIYKSPDGPEIQVKLEQETVWLDAHLIAKIFGIQRPAVVKHISNIYKTGELSKKSTCSVLEQVATDGKIRQMNLYNLDVIISVGYRVNSQRATQFRVWANKILKQYLIKGYAVNEKRLIEAQNKFYELQETVAFLQRQSKKELLTGQEAEILSLLADYSKTLSLLDMYDRGNLKDEKGKKSKFVLEYGECVKIIVELRKELIVKKEASDLFGQERGRGFEGIIKGLNQTFGGKELYATIEEKAAHLLYLTIKDHPFSDGNKRTGAFLFIFWISRIIFLKNSERGKLMITRWRRWRF